MMQYTLGVVDADYSDVLAGTTGTINFGLRRDAAGRLTLGSRVMLLRMMADSIEKIWVAGGAAVLVDGHVTRDELVTMLPALKADPLNVDRITEREPPDPDQEEG